jgi:hypothetical protein
MNWNSISRDELLRWSSDAFNSDGTLPELVSRLIIETGSGVLFVDAPSGTGVSTGGFDLIVEATDDSLYVPSGTSVWETSVQTGAHGKAEKDFDKRTAGPRDLPTQEVHYRAVSSQPWTKRKDFDLHDDEGLWKSVRGLNVDALVTWLSIAPGTTAWMRATMGISTSGSTHWSTWWSRWIKSTSIPLNSAVVLAGRGDLVQRISELSKSNGITSFGGEELSWNAALAVFCASARAALDEDPLALLPSRLVIFDDEGAFLEAVSSGRPVVALIPEASWVERLPEQADAHIFVHTHPAHLAALNIPAIDSEEAARALERQGAPFVRAYELGHLARRDILTLRRELATQPALHTPAWAKRELTVQERRIALLPRWNYDFDGDRTFAAALLVERPEDVSELWTRLLRAEGHPTAAFGAFHYLVSPTDTWRLVSHALTVEDLAKFETLAIDALYTPNPLAAMEVGERLKAQLEGVVPVHSGDIASGIGTVLALMGSDDTDGLVTDMPSVAERVVHASLFPAGTPVPLQDLTGRPIRLSLFAEAAPDSTLDYIDQIAASTPANEIFTDSKEKGHVTFGPASPHLELLRALLVLSWSTDHLSRVVSILLRLHELDPGGTWANRPQSALRDALSPASWNTSVAWSQRLDVVRNELASDGSNTWATFADFVRDDGFQISEPGPIYRKWGPRVNPDTMADVVRRRGELMAVLVGSLESAPQARTAVELLQYVDEHGRQLVIDRVRTLQSEWDDSEKAGLYEELRDLIAHHTEFADAHWAMTASEIAPLSALLEELVPTDLRLKYAWLFKPGMTSLIDFPRNGNWEEHAAELQRRRLTALQEIESAFGFDSMVEFIAGLPDLSTATWALDSGPNAISESQLLSLINFGSPRREVAMSYLARHSYVDPGMPRRMLEAGLDLDLGIRAHILQFVRPIADVLSLLEQESEDVADAYWSAFSPWGVTLEPAVVERVVLTLTERDQAGLAVTTLDVHGEGVNSAVIDTVLSALLEGKIGAVQAEATGVEHLLTRYADEPENLNRATQLEWAFLPALSDSRQLAIHRAMASRAETFVEVAGLRFSEDSQQNSRAWRVLHSWSAVPGAQADGAIDESKLQSWFDEVEAAIEDWDAKRRSIVWGIVGEMLAKTLNDPSDGIWPPLGARAVVNRASNAALDEGIGRGLYNGRGATWRNPTGGGISERHLALTYRDQAAALPPTDRIATILRNLAASYEQNGKREDFQAEARKLGLTF